MEHEGHLNTRTHKQHAYARVDNPQNHDNEHIRLDQNRKAFANQLRPTSATGTDWLPPSLKLPAVGVFIIALLCLLAALIFIRQYAIQHHGIELLTLNHYTWTYGPTAVFIILISYWRLIDYHCKALTPWAELQNGPVNAERSILLDHLSPFLAFTLWAAARNRQLAVVLTIIGFVLLKVVTVASTGLFFPAPVTVGPFETSMVQTSQFDTATNFSDGYSDPGPAPFYTAYAIMQRGLPLPEGISTNMLYETVEPVGASEHSNSTFTVQSRAFIPQVNCEPVDVLPLINFDEFGSTVNQYEQLQVQNTTKWSCPPRTGFTGDGLTILTCDAATRICPPRQLYPSWAIHDCVRNEGAKDTDTSPYLIAISDVRITQTFNQSISNYSLGNMLDPSSWDFAIPKITGMLCSIEYEMDDVELQYNTTLEGNPVQRVGRLFSSSAEDSKLKNLSNEFLAQKLSYASPGTTGGARDMFGISTDYDMLLEQPHTVLTMVGEQAGGGFEALLDDPGDFQKAAEFVMNTMLLQVANEGIMIANTNETFKAKRLPGNEEYVIQRLEVQMEALIVMVVCLGLLTLLCVAIVFLRPKIGTSTNLETISAAGNLLRNSGEMHNMLNQCASCSEKIAADRLRAAEYCTESAGSNTVLHCMLPKQSDHLTIPAPNSSTPGYYSPLALTKICLIITLVLAPLAIALLEVLQHLSDSSGLLGIATVRNASSFNISVYTRFLPALVALLIATCYNCLDFYTAMLAPYNKMFSKNASLKDLGKPPFAQLPPMALLTAVRRGYWASFLTGLGALIGSVLTIVVSGLYTVEFIPDPLSALLLAGDSWNVSLHQGFATDNAAAAVSSLIESSNLSYPSFTYDGLAFPRLSLDVDSILSSDISGVLEAMVPALRAELACESIGWSMINYSIDPFVYKGVVGDPVVNFNGTVPLPENCHLGSSYGNESTVTMTVLDIGFNSPNNDTYIGIAEDIHVGPWQDDINFWASGTAPKDQPDNAPGCPSLALVYGYIDGNDTSNSAWSSLLCYQKLQQIMTNVTLDVSGKKVLFKSAPVPDESTAEYLFSGPNNETAFWWQLQANLEWPFTIFDNDALDPYLVDYDSGTGSSIDFANFFRGAFFGKTPIPLSTIRKNDTDSQALILDHAQKFYRRYMAQYISSNLRVSADASAATRLAKRQDNIVGASTIPGSFSPTAGTPRLVQHRIPKLVMQIMLAIMFVCGALALWLGQYHKLVLWNPCTIAGAMVLFAGSRMCRPDSSEYVEGRGQQDYRPNRDGNSYEMANFSRPRGGKGYSQVEQDEAGKSALVYSSAIPAHRGLDAADWQDKQAKFRLGWWRDDTFVERSKGPYEDGDAKSGRWRYGTDVL